MVYLYRCLICDGEYEIEKPADMAAHEEICPLCNVALSRVYTAPRLNLATLSIREKADLHDYKLRTGSEAVCIGNERPKSYTPKLEDYTLPPEVMARLN